MNYTSFYYKLFSQFLHKCLLHSSQEFLRKYPRKFIQVFPKELFLDYLQRLLQNCFKGLQSKNASKNFSITFIGIFTGNLQVFFHEKFLGYLFNNPLEESLKGFQEIFPTESQEEFRKEPFVGISAGNTFFLIFRGIH